MVVIVEVDSQVVEVVQAAEIAEDSQEVALVDTLVAVIVTEVEIAEVIANSLEAVQVEEIAVDSQEVVLVEEKEVLVQEEIHTDQNSLIN